MPDAPAPGPEPTPEGDDRALDHDYPDDLFDLDPEPAK